MKALHELHEGHRAIPEKLLVTTRVSDECGTRIVKSEVSNAKLV